LPARLYEAMYIVRPEATDDELQALMGRVADTIGQIEGTIDLHDVWERRELAYAIDDCKRGIYVICYFNAESTAIDALRRELDLEEQVLRHMIVVPNPRAIWRPISAAAVEVKEADAASEAPAEEASVEPEPAEEPAPESSDEDAPPEGPSEEAPAVEPEE